MGKHAIIVIKNKKHEYLQYFDKKWNSYLFMNCKMANKEDIDSIIEELNKSLEIEKKNVRCHFIGEKKHTKYSESAKREKEYIHYFYKIELLSEIDKLKKNEFEFLNKKYKWFSLNELEKDKRIQKVNSDIVNYVKELDKDNA